MRDTYENLAAAIQDLARYTGSYPSGAILFLETPELETRVTVEVRHRAADLDRPIRMPHYSVSSAGLMAELRSAADGTLLLNEIGQISPGALKSLANGLNNLRRRGIGRVVVFGTYARTLRDRWLDVEDVHRIAKELDLPLYRVDRDGPVFRVKEEPTQARAPSAEKAKADPLASLLDVVEEVRREKYGPRFKPRGTTAAAQIEVSPFGVCKRCAVCLRFDTARGCCTVCGRPLSPLSNPQALKRSLLR